MSRPGHEFDILGLGISAICRKCGLEAKPFVEYGPVTKGFVSAVLRVENAKGLRVPPYKVRCKKGRV